MAWDIEYTDEFGDWWETLTEAGGAIIMARPFNELRDKMSPERRERNHQRALELLAQLPLTELRHARQLSQQQLAGVLHVKQASISKMERRTDMYISTLRNFIRAMGGELEIIARFPDGSVQINQFEELGANQP